MRSIMLLKILPFLTAYLYECVASSSTVQAFVGSNALLHCDCQGKTTLYWQDEEEKIIASNENGSSADHSKFTNRTQLFKHEDKKNCSLLILGVKVSDQGNYKCYRMNPKPIRDDLVSLTVVANYSELSCSKNSKTDELTCGASNGYPKGNISWLRDGQHEFYSNDTTTNEDGSSLLYTLRSTLKGSVGHNVQCLVKMPGQIITVNCSEDKSKSKELRVASDSSDWAIGVSVISTLVVALCVLVVYLNYRRKRARVPDQGDNANESERPFTKESEKGSAEGRHDHKTGTMLEI